MYRNIDIYVGVYVCMYISRYVWFNYLRSYNYMTSKECHLNLNAKSLTDPDYPDSYLR